jgi:hypothetical protein
VKTTPKAKYLLSNFLVFKEVFGWGVKPLKEKSRPHNTGLAKVAVQYSSDTFVVNQSLVLRINICGENRHLRQARNRSTQFPCHQLVQKGF